MKLLLSVAHMAALPAPEGAGLPCVTEESARSTHAPQWLRWSVQGLVAEVVTASRPDRHKRDARWRSVVVGGSFQSAVERFPVLPR